VTESQQEEFSPYLTFWWSCALVVTRWRSSWKDAEYVDNGVRLGWVGVQEARQKQVKYGLNKVARFDFNSGNCEFSSNAMLLKPSL